MHSDLTLVISEINTADAFQEGALRLIGGNEDITNEIKEYGAVSIASNPAGPGPGPPIPVVLGPNPGPGGPGPDLGEPIQNPQTSKNL